MNARRFAVPCVTCGEAPDHWKHTAPFRATLGSLDTRPQCTYVADTASPEYAAVKLREALDAVLIYAETAEANACSVREAERIYGQIAVCDAAIALADAAGITLLPSTEHQ